MLLWTCLAVLAANTGIAFGNDAGGHNRMVESLMALREINADPTLLPDTQIKFEFMDSKRSSGVALKGAIKMVDQSFGGAVPMSSSSSSSVPRPRPPP